MILIGISILEFLAILVLVILLIIRGNKTCPNCPTCPTCPTCTQIPVCADNQTAVLPLFPPQLNALGYGSFIDANGACNVLDTIATVNHTETGGNTVWNCAVINQTDFNIRFYYQKLISHGISGCTGAQITYSGNAYPIPPQDPSNELIYIFQAVDNMLFEITTWNVSNSTWDSMPIYQNGVGGSTSTSLSFTTPVSPVIVISNTSGIRADITY